MELTVKALLSLLVLVSVTGVYSEELPVNLQEHSSKIRIECMTAELVGALICPLLDQALLIGKVPLFPQLLIPNITEFLINILPNSNVSSKIDGSVEFRNVTIVDLRATDIQTCDFGTGKDLSVDLIGHFKNLTLETVYTVNATVDPDMPLLGEGRASISLDFLAGVLTNVQFCPTDEPMHMNSLNYTLSLPTPFVIAIEGLLGEPEFVEEITNEVIQLIDELRLEIIQLDQLAHENIAKLLLSIINSLVLNKLIPCDVLLLQTILGGCDV